MDIAIIGAGRIGSTFGFHLARAGHSVTMIARGARFELLRNEKAIVAVNGDRAPIKVETRLDRSYEYDLVIVSVLAHQVDSILPELVSSAAKAVMFMFNTFEKIERLREAIGVSRFSFGFPNMSAFISNGLLKSKVDGPGMITTLSNETWKELLTSSGMPAEIERDMNSFLRSHVAMVIPFMVAGLITFENNRGLTWMESKRLSMAWIEALDVVRLLGHKLLPKFLSVLSRFPLFMLTSLMWLFSRNDAVRNLGEFGPTEVRLLIDAMADAAPEHTRKLLMIRP